MESAYKFLERVSQTTHFSEGDVIEVVDITDAHHAIKLALLDAFNELDALGDLNQIKASLRDRIDTLKRKNYLR